MSIKTQRKTKVPANTDDEEIPEIIADGENESETSEHFSVLGIT